MPPQLANQPRSYPVAVVAIGGNSLIADKHKVAVSYQWEAVRETARHIVALIREGWTVLVTHGNGPQVGFIMRRNELAAAEVHATPLDLIVADTQGSIGYMLQQALNNEFAKGLLYRRAFSIVTQVVVDKADPAFQNPTKPVGSFMDEAQAKQMEAEGWTLVEDAGRGWRRVVASPEPKQVFEMDAIAAAVNNGWIVIAGGGGGIPVAYNWKGEVEGVAAVIDKDRLSALMAINVQADLFIISTGVERVAINFNKPDQQDLAQMSASEARQYLADGQFPAGSMGPKIESVLRYLDNGGKKAIITNPPNLRRAMRGQTGTLVLTD
ncbi:MAG: carbamate kinase [Anaerolineales bacterium]|nr:carbamate kinase [Anaerolineales bacterium]MCB9172168.1 carbamate kinase [Ardenticatenales bacterium]